MPEETPRDAPLARAVTLLEAGDWRAAHALVQHERSPLAAWLHGIAHTLEGDLDNARYWYRRLGRPFPGAGAVARELALARGALEAGEAPAPPEG
jgi:hypothetical protein